MNANFPFTEFCARMASPRLFASRIRFVSTTLLAALLLLSLSPALRAQYVVTPLDSNLTAEGTNPVDSDLVNAWGITSLGGSPLWVSDNGTGLSTLYNSAGVLQKLVVTIMAAGGSAAQGQPTGVLGNTSPSSFVVSVTTGGITKSGKATFLFATLDGAIEGWNSGVLPTTAVIGADRSKFGASYSALAIFTNTSGESFLYATNTIKGGGIDMFNGSFGFVQTFSDPGIPQDFAPYGIRLINGQLWVTYTSTKKANSGFVAVFEISNTDGTLTKLFEIHGPLHQPWGLALAPPDFGPFSNDVLIGDNITRGQINAFDAVTGNFVGVLRDTSGQPIEINELWGLDFGTTGNNGTPQQLFFTAGPDNYADGLFGVITVGP